MPEPGRPPEAEKPLTREDVLRLIEEHGGPVRLDLAGKDLRGIDLRGVDLRGANLHGAFLKAADLHQANLNGANLSEVNASGVDLREADLRTANLKEADLGGAELQGARLDGAAFSRAYLADADLREVEGFINRVDLSGAYLVGAKLQDARLLANFEGADLHSANLKGAKVPGANFIGACLREVNLNEADLEGADLSVTSLYNVRLYYANLHNINWGDFVLREELDGHFEAALQSYRSLKAYHTQAGMGDIAGQFFYREKEAQRKLAKQERRYKEFLWLQVFRFFAGYGEKPFRILGWYLGTILLVTMLLYLLSLLTTIPTALAAQELFRSRPLQQDDLPDVLELPYYFMVSFTSLGYGNWVLFQGTLLTIVGPLLSGLGAVGIGLFVAFLARKSGR